ncbi:hypothetical protein GY45DRAFT_711263 [Cubamyces sp. BRFM 1775]|nr:hypothetical protein GY45DRAFT_711263 [Cubamyces sp. BRFM 1775]
MDPQVARAPTRAAAALVVAAQAGAWNCPVPLVRVGCRMRPICAALAIWVVRFLADMFEECQLRSRSSACLTCRSLVFLMDGASRGCLTGQWYCHAWLRSPSMDIITSVCSPDFCWRYPTDLDVSVPPPPPPPAMPLPRPPALAPKRAASVDNFSERGRMSPMSVKRSSSPVPFKPLSPPPIVRTTPTPPRPFSVMSQSTDQDLMAIAELLSPTVDSNGTDGEMPASETAPVAELEPVPDVFFDEAVATTSIRDSMSSSISSAYSSYHRPSTASVRSSIYTDSDGASYMGDDLPDPSVLYSLHSNGFHGGFHLPRSSLPMPPLDDNRSLSSATSYSSLRTPSLSRHSSVQFLSSPPVSPTSSYLPTPIDAPSPSPQPPLKSLDVIEEARYGEDQELRRVPSDDAQTINMGTPSGSSFPPVEPFIMRKPEPRHPPQGVSTLQRRLPELDKLRISTRAADHTPSPSPSSAARHSQQSASLPVPASPVLSARSSSSGASSHRGSGTGKSGFGKLFGRGDKDKDKDKESKKSGSSVSGSNQSVLSLDLGSSKSEEKRLKKEAARARTERLAQDLADKAKKRAEEAKAAKANRVKTKSSRPWEEEGGMYEGISYF